MPTCLSLGSGWNHSLLSGVVRAGARQRSTGALTGITLDPFGAALPVVTIDLIMEGGSERTKCLGCTSWVAWQILRSKAPVVLRAGYGTFYSRPTGQAFYQSMFGAPFSQFRLNAGAANKDATFSEPFAQPFPTPASFPQFPRYSPTSNTTVYAVAPNFRPAMINSFH